MAAWGETSVAIAALALLWLGIGVAVSVVAARRLRIAQDVIDAARANAHLIDLMPARPVVVRADRRIEADEQLIRTLGLEARPSSLSELAGNDSGIVAQDLEALTVEIEAAQASAGRISFPMPATSPGSC